VYLYVYQTQYIDRLIVFYIHQRVALSTLDPSPPEHWQSAVCSIPMSWSVFKCIVDGVTHIKLVDRCVTSSAIFVHARANDRWASKCRVASHRRRRCRVGVRSPPPREEQRICITWERICVTLERIYVSARQKRDARPTVHQRIVRVRRPRPTFRVKTPCASHGRLDRD